MNVDDMHPLRRIQIALNQCEINNHFENNYMMQCLTILSYQHQSLF